MTLADFHNPTAYEGSKDSTITGIGLDVGIHTYCLCANWQAMRESDPEEQKKEKEIQDKYDKCDFNIPTHKEVIDGEDSMVADLPDTSPFDIWVSGWGFDYATCVAHVIAKGAPT